MTVHITGVEITADKVTIEAVNLESVLYSEDLFEDFDATPVTFEFSRKENGARELKYLYKICRSQKKNENATSLGQMITNLTGMIINLSENFKVA